MCRRLNALHVVGYERQCTRCVATIGSPAVSAHDRSLRSVRSTSLGLSALWSAGLRRCPDSLPLASAAPGCRPAQGEQRQPSFTSGDRGAHCSLGPGTDFCCTRKLVRILNSFSYLAAALHDVTEARDKKAFEVVVWEDTNSPIAVVPKGDQTLGTYLRADGREALGARTPRHRLAAWRYNIRHRLQAIERAVLRRAPAGEGKQARDTEHESSGIGAEHRRLWLPGYVSPSNSAAVSRS